MTGAVEDPALEPPQGEDVPGTREIRRLCQAIAEGSDRRGPVEGADPGAPRAYQVNRHPECRPVERRVLCDHHRDLELRKALRSQRDADQAAAVAMKLSPRG